MNAPMPLRQLLESIADIPMELQADLETGSHHLNNRASEEFALRHHRLMKKLAEVANLARIIEEAYL